MSAGASDGFKAIADFWSAQGRTMLDAQQSAARSMAEGMQTMFGVGMKLPLASTGAPTELAHAGQAMMQLWSAANELSTQLAGRLGQASGGSAVMKDVLERMTDPKQWMAGNGDMDEALARMADGPRLADLWDVERRYAAVMRRWTELRQRSFEHQRIVLEAWMQACQQYMATLAKTEGEALEPKQAVALWTEIGNRHMLTVQRSEPFLKSQRDLIRASTELRLAQGELTEFLGKQYGLPTRSELDDVHRSLTDMRRELRKVRRELDAAKQPKTVAAAETAPTPLPAKSRAGLTRPPSRREAR